MTESGMYFFQLYWAEFLKKTLHLNTEQVGAYFLLLCHHYACGSIPLDAASRAQICRVSLSHWRRKLAPQINPFFDEHGRNKRAVEEMEKAEIARTKRVLAGARGGRATATRRSIGRLKRPALL